MGYDDETTVALSNALWHALDGDRRAMDAELGKLDTATLRAMHRAAVSLRLSARRLAADRARVTRAARRH
jgi:hypothetical protein